MASPCTPGSNFECRAAALLNRRAGAMGLWKDDYTVKVRYVDTDLQHSRSHKYRNLTLVSYFIQNPQPSLLQSGL